MFLEQIKRENIKPENIKAVLITHAHRDAIGGLKDLDKWINHNLDLFYPERVNIHRFVKKFNNIYPTKIQTGSTNSIFGNNIVSFRVIHAEAFPTGKYFPAYGYRINNLVYVEDMESIPKESIKYFENADTIIADGAMWFGKQIRGHLSINKTLLLAKRFEPKDLIIIQAGRTYPSQNEAEKEIKNYWNKIKEDTKTNIILSYDGLKIDTKKLVEELPGLYLPKPHAEMIWKGEKKLIVKAKNYPSMINRPLYFMDKKFAYGILKLKEPKEINLDEFEKLIEKHKVTNKKREKWWKGKKTFYAYEFDILDKFSDAKPINLPQGIQTFIKEVKFMAETGSTNVSGSPINIGGLQPIWVWKDKKRKKLEIENIEKLNLQIFDNNELIEIHNQLHKIYKNGI